jgi:hypothetical protein
MGHRELCRRRSAWVKPTKRRASLRRSPHPWPLPHARPDGRRRSLATRRVQKVQGQAVSQRRAGSSHRDHHQRVLRFRDRSCTAQSARPAGGRLCGQPTVVTRRISPSRLPHRRRLPSYRHRTRPIPNGPRASASPTHASTRSCTRSVSSRSRPPGFGTATSAITSSSSIAVIRTRTPPER